MHDSETQAVGASGILLDVCRNSGRSYIQGSQIISAASKLLPHNEGRNWRLKQATFQKLTGNRVALDRNALTINADDHVGWIEFQSGDEVCRQFIKTTDIAAPACNLASAVLSHVGGHAETHAMFRYQAAYGFWQLLDAIVQASKTQHEALYPGIRSIVLISFRHCDVPVTLPHDWQTGCIALDLIRSVRQRDHVQTMNKFTLLMDDVQRATGAFSMAIYRH